MEKKEVLTGYAVAVLDRGFVYVGNVEVSGDWCVIANARNIRYWGTTNGLGELIQNGPTSKTKLDVVGTIRAPVRALISLIETEEKKWNLS